MTTKSTVLTASVALVAVLLLIGVFVRSMVKVSALPVSPASPSAQSRSAVDREEQFPPALAGTIRPSAKQGAGGPPPDELTRQPRHVPPAETAGSKIRLQRSGVVATKAKPAFPASVGDYLARFGQAVQLKALGERWQALRAMGIILSDNEFIEAVGGGTPESPDDWAKYQHAMLSYWVKKDPASALAWAYAFRDYPEEAFTFGSFDEARYERGYSYWHLVNQHELFRQMSAQWAMADLPSALAWIDQLPKDYSQQWAISGAASTLILTDLDRARAMVPTNTWAYAMFLDEAAVKLAVRDSSEAASWAAKLSQDEGRQAAIVSVARQWTKEDSAQTLAWIAELGDWDAQVALHNINIDPAAIRYWAQTLPADKDALRGSAYQLVVLDLFNQNREWAIQFVNGLPQAPSKDQALSSLLTAWTRVDPEAANDWLEALPPSPAREQLSTQTAKIEIEMAVAGSASINDVVNLIQELPSSSQEQAMKDAVLAWRYKNPEELSAWFQTQPAGADKDALILYAIRGRDYEGQAFVDLISQIADEKKRTEKLIILALSWYNTDRQAALNWIPQAPIPLEIKDRLGVLSTLAIDAVNLVILVP